MTKISAMIALLSLGACSLIDVHGPPARMPEHGPVRCTDTALLPIIDTMFAVAGIGLGAFTYVSTRAPVADSGAVFVILGVPALLVGLVDGASAVYGYGAVSRCNRAKVTASSTPLHAPE